MRLLVWKNTCPNPCDDPRVTISIAPAVKGKVFPWVLPVEEAQEIFGFIIQKITDPVEITLRMALREQED